MSQEEPPIKRTRLSAEARRSAILAEAGSLFAEAGFDVSTREIAKRCGITQAALYKHFDSKDDIVQAVFRTRYLERDRTEFVLALEAPDLPLEPRITNAYTALYRRMNRERHRLFFQAAMVGYQLPIEYSEPLDQSVLLPLSRHLRADCGLHDVETVPWHKDERELMLMLHSVVIFLAIRRNIYNVDMDPRAPALIAQDVRVWLTGARVQVREILQLPASSA